MRRFTSAAATSVAAAAASATASRPPLQLPIYFSPIYTHPLPDKHSFPMERYEAVVSELWRRMDPNTMKIVRPRGMANVVDILRAHQQSFVMKYLRGNLSKQEERQIGFPWTRQFVDRTLTITQSSIQAAEDVLLRGLPAACNAAGGTHHAFSDHGEGYCIFNDIGVVGRLATQALGVRQVIVVDLDVHQGNGTAEIFRKDDDVFTFSLQGAKNYPWRSRFPSDLDIDVEDSVTDDDYLREVARGLQLIQDRCIAKLPPIDSANRTACGLRGDVLLMFQAGVDPLAEDRWGRLKLTREGLQRRNAAVFGFAFKNSLPIITLMGGGYSRPIERSAEAHVDVFEQAAAHFQRCLSAMS